MPTRNQRHEHVRELPSGDLAFIGDVHGELDALEQLLSHLDPSLTLVYLGDLADRGPDSPGVIDLVRRQMDADRARCILGNHELSVLRREYKKYNAWFFPDEPEWAPKKNAAPIAMRRLSKDAHIEGVWDFFNSLPVALEREDVRAVHAAWDSEHIETLRDQDLPAHRLFDHGPKNDLPEPPRYADEADETPPHDHERDHAWEAKEMAAQNDNPIRYATSGGERAVTQREDIGWYGHKWRPLARDPWWKSYREDPHVIIGHYSRQLQGATRPIFRGVTDTKAPLGPTGRVWCIDYGIGNKALGAQDPRLAALVWRDGGASRELVFHGGERFVV